MQLWGRETRIIEAEIGMCRSDAGKIGLNRGVAKRTDRRRRKGDHPKTQSDLVDRKCEFTMNRGKETFERTTSGCVAETRGGSDARD
jgi:hypothetical protein